MPPRLSAIDAVNPAFQRVSELLFRRFRISRWLKFGFIGWTAGAAGVGSFNFSYRAPTVPSVGQGDNPFKDLPGIIREMQASLAVHAGLLFLLAGLVVLLVLVGAYFACRFRFIQFDAVLSGNPDIARPWSRYASQADTFFLFWMAYLLISWAGLFFVLVLPLWRALKNGTFSGSDPLTAFFAVFATLFLGLAVFGLIFGIIAALANDFVVPILALDNRGLGSAFSALKEMIRAEPGAFAGYLGMKLVLSIAGGVCLAIAFFIGFLVLLVPMVLLLVAGVMLAAVIKSVGAAGLALGIFLLGLGVLVAAVLVLGVMMAATAPFAVFFTAYSFYFFGGRYLRLGALLWPAPPPPIPPSLPGPAAV